MISVVGIGLEKQEVIGGKKQLLCIPKCSHWEALCIEEKLIAEHNWTNNSLMTSDLAQARYIIYFDFVLVFDESDPKPALFSSRRASQPERTLAALWIILLKLFRATQG